MVSALHKRRTENCLWDLAIRMMLLILERHLNEMLWTKAKGQCVHSEVSEWVQ